MRGLDLAALIPAPNASVDAGVFQVVTIPAFGHHLLGRDDQGRACVLIASVDAATRPPIRLGGLDVQYATTCEVSFAGRPAVSQTFTVVTSTGVSPEAEDYFLHVLGTVIEIVGVSPTLSEVADAITQLASIFQRLAAGSRENAAGVIGELLVIELSTSPAEALAAWRKDPTERYDFVSEDLRLEVKSSLSRRREHWFSFEQTQVPESCTGIVASVFVEPSSGLKTLSDHVAAKLRPAPGALFDLEATLARTLGSDLPQALSFCFDYELAKSSLRFYAFNSIPRIEGPLAPEIRNVRFTADLTSSAPVDPGPLSMSASPFAPFQPRGAV